MTAVAHLPGGSRPVPEHIMIRCMTVHMLRSGSRCASTGSLRDSLLLLQQQMLGTIIWQATARPRRLVPSLQYHCSCCRLILQVLGAKRKNLAGYSAATVRPHQGFIYGCQLIQQTPPALQPKAARLVGAKCTLLARIDAYGQDPSGQV